MSTDPAFDVKRTRIPLIGLWKNTTLSRVAPVWSTVVAVGGFNIVAGVVEKSIPSMETGTIFKGISAVLDVLMYNSTASCLPPNHTSTGSVPV